MQATYSNCQAGDAGRLLCPRILSQTWHTNARCKPDDFSASMQPLTEHSQSSAQLTGSPPPQNRRGRASDLMFHMNVVPMPHCPPCYLAGAIKPKAKKRQSVQLGPLTCTTERLMAVSASDSFTTSGRHSHLVVMAARDCGIVAENSSTCRRLRTKSFPLGALYPAKAQIAEHARREMAPGVGRGQEVVAMLQVPNPQGLAPAASCPWAPPAGGSV